MKPFIAYDIYFTLDYDYKRDLTKRARVYCKSKVLPKIEELTKYYLNHYQPSQIKFEVKEVYVLVKQ